MNFIELKADNSKSRKKNSRELKKINNFQLVSPA